MKNILLVFIASTFMIACKSDKQKMEDAKQVVETFVKDLELENYISVNKIYPSFSKIGKYWILYDFSITDSKIDKDVITIYGTYKQGNTRNQSIMFVLKPSEENGDYIIEKSKGLSSYFGSDEYEFFKNIGCLRGLETDEEIANACNTRIDKYELLVSNLRGEIEKSVNDNMKFIDSQTDYYGNKKQIWNIIHGFGTSAIPSDSYEIDMLELEVIDGSLKGTGNFVPITNIETLYPNTSTKVILSDPTNYKAAYPFFKIIKTDFIKKSIANNKSWSLDCSSLDKLPN